MNKKIVILGGGTVVHVRNHFALAAPAYGSTARKLAALCMELIPALDVDLHLTKMAGGFVMETNEDIERFVHEDVVTDLAVKIVFFNVAMCDFEPNELDTTTGDEHVSHVFGKKIGRLSSSGDGYVLAVKSAIKVIDSIRSKRKDIFLIGFKTTCGDTQDNMYIKGLNLLKRASCNLVLVNDTGTRMNMIVTPEEARYHITPTREEALRNLVDMAALRSHLTFTQSTVVAGEPVDWKRVSEGGLVPENLYVVVNNCIAQKAYKPFRGATVGHFAFKLSDEEFITSIRKSNFNDLPKLGMVRIKTDGPDSVLAYGAKPSVGGQSQRIVFSDHTEFDCIVHFHCPMKASPTHQIPQASQREYECGSHECGANTSNSLGYFGLMDENGHIHRIGAVFLKEHGPNIVFSKSTPGYLINQFIEDNFDLGAKTGGYVS